MALSGCGGTASGPPGAEPSVAPHPSGGETPVIGSLEAENDLVVRAAAAVDRHFTADYTLTRDSGDPVTVAVSLAGDGTWQIDIPGGASGGKADVTMVYNRQGYYQCVDAKKTSCMDVTDDDGIDRRYDPLVPHLFSDWLTMLRDRKLAVSIAYTKRLHGLDKTSSCYSLRHNSIEVGVPVPEGVYCLRADGTITGAHASFGTLLLTGDPAAAPEHITLPADISDDDPLSTKAPPKPSKTPEPSKPSKSPSGKPDD